MQRLRELASQEHHLFRWKTFVSSLKVQILTLWQTYSPNLRDSSHTTSIFPVRVKNELSVKVQWRRLVLFSCLKCDSASHIKLTRPQTPGKFMSSLYLGCAKRILPFYRNEHLFSLISRQATDAWRIGPLQCCSICFPEQRWWWCFLPNGAFCQSLLTGTWMSDDLKGFCALVAFLWRWLDLKCASCEPKPLFFPCLCTLLRFWHLNV